MRLRNFLVIVGLWIALLPYIGFSIATENVLFSISGFLLIVSSFYVAAIEDKHKHKRIIQDKPLSESKQKLTEAIQKIRKQRKEKTSVTNSENQTTPDTQKETTTEHVEHKETQAEPEEDTGPRIKKAVHDVQIDMNSIDDIVS